MIPRRSMKCWQPSFNFCAPTSFDEFQKTIPCSASSPGSLSIGRTASAAAIRGRENSHFGGGWRNRLGRFYGASPRRRPCAVGECYPQICAQYWLTANKHTPNRRLLVRVQRGTRCGCRAALQRRARISTGNGRRQRWHRLRTLSQLLITGSLTYALG
jgi:hypothetical protein